ELELGMCWESDGELWERDLKDASDPIQDGDSEEQWTVNEKTDVDEALSISVEEHNSLPSEADLDSLLSDRTSFLSGMDRNVFIEDVNHIYFNVAVVLVLGAECDYE
nr:hypothetical protein [Tanacetum cinerariifolium]